VPKGLALLGLFFCDIDRSLESAGEEAPAIIPIVGSTEKTCKHATPCDKVWARDNVRFWDVGLLGSLVLEPRENGENVFILLLIAVCQIA